MPRILPVIHIDTLDQALDQSELAFECNAEGVFFICHHNDDRLTINAAHQCKQRHPEKWIGINLLYTKAVTAYMEAVATGLNAMWTDSPGVSSEGLTVEGHILKSIQAKTPHIKVYASVAFKYQPDEPHPEEAVRNACTAGFIPCTSGAATGVAADVSKIAHMYEASTNGLALASGVTLENFKQYEPFTTDMLVATGVSRDDYHFDYERLTLLIALSKR